MTATTAAAAAAAAVAAAQNGTAGVSAGVRHVG
jgi:hypothetical protein